MKWDLVEYSSEAVKIHVYRSRDKELRGPGYSETCFLLEFPSWGQGEGLASTFRPSLTHHLILSTSNSGAPVTFQRGSMFFLQALMKHGPKNNMSASRNPLPPITRLTRLLTGHSLSGVCHRKVSACKES